MLDGSHRSVSELVHLFLTLLCDLYGRANRVLTLHKAACTRARLRDRLVCKTQVCRDDSLALLCSDSSLVQLDHRRLVSLEFVLLHDVSWLRLRGCKRLIWLIEELVGLNFAHWSVSCRFWLRC